MEKSGSSYRLRGENYWKESGDTEGKLRKQAPGRTCRDGLQAGG